MDKSFFIIAVSAFLSTGCIDHRNVKHPQISLNPNTSQQKEILNHDVYSDDTSKSCKCSAQFELKDSLSLIHIKNQFYKSSTGHLYELTVGIRDVNGELTDREYFNGFFSQEVDPLSFEPLDGWYAKDKNYVYYYRQVSGGMQISKMKTADSKTFKMLPGHYKYAVDKGFYYDETDIIEGFLPNNTKLKLDNKGRAIALICNHKKYKLELLD